MSFLADDPVAGSGEVEVLAHQAARRHAILRRAESSFFVAAPVVAGVVIFAAVVMLNASKANTNVVIAHKARGAVGVARAWVAGFTYPKLRGGVGCVGGGVAGRGVAGAAAVALGCTGGSEREDDEGEGDFHLRVSLKRSIFFYGDNTGGSHVDQETRTP